jgi:hypothetical protein
VFLPAFLEIPPSVVPLHENHSALISTQLCKHSSRTGSFMSITRHHLLGVTDELFRDSGDSLHAAVGVALAAGGVGDPFRRN